MRDKLDPLCRGRGARRANPHDPGGGRRTRKPFEFSQDGYKEPYRSMFTHPPVIKLRFDALKMPPASMAGLFVGGGCVCEFVAGPRDLNKFSKMRGPSPPIFLKTLHRPDYIRGCFKISHPPGRKANFEGVRMRKNPADIRPGSPISDMDAPCRWVRRSERGTMPPSFMLRTRGMHKVLNSCLYMRTPKQRRVNRCTLAPTRMGHRLNPARHGQTLDLGG
jgi:hypothetical protein